MNERRTFDYSTVELRAEIDIGGQRVQALSHVRLDIWNAGPEYQERLKAETLFRLAEEVVRKLAPEVEVTMPAPTVREALTDALRPFDYPAEY